MSDPTTTRPLKYMSDLDYSVVQQCMHCGMCLPSCPTYLETREERNSPRGRIALMRSIADGDLEVTKAFGEEMYYCLGCLACTTACPAGVDYPVLFENARAEIEEADVLFHPERRFWRWLALKQLFAAQWKLRLVGRALWLYQASGLCRLVRASGLLRLLPKNLRELEPTTPIVQRRFSDALIGEVEPAKTKKHRVGMLTGCVQDLVFSHTNRDTVDVLLANNCEVVTPRSQGCCGSLHAHNGDLEQAAVQARHMIDLFDLDSLDAIITNAAGCGSHLKHFSGILKHDEAYLDKARQWDSKVRDISEWLVEIGFRKPEGDTSDSIRTTYHEACHLCHGQGISSQPRSILNAIPGLQMVELENATHCCGSAGIYNITQPEQAGKLQEEKVACIEKTGATLVATANPGCHLQIQNGLGDRAEVRHPVSLLAEAYRKERAAE
ncbi:(Fe-S)-binding protein [Verrucomicrobiales bacterium BCK34]|nr:(Fe-S)-binding protein [Verrucomicrobiales bacterium BCK34]